MNTQEFLDKCKSIEHSSSRDQTILECIKVGKNCSIPVHAIVLIINSFIEKRADNVRFTLTDGWVTGSRIYHTDTESNMKNVDNEKQDITFDDIPKTKNHDVKNKTPFIIVGIILLLIIGFTILYYFYIIDDATRLYVLPMNLNIRSSQTTASSVNIIKQLPFGTEVIVYAMDTNWARVKVKDPIEEINGYIGSPNKYLVTKRDCEEIQGIFENQEAFNLVRSSFAKKALLRYFRKTKKIGILPDEIIREAYPQGILGYKVWQVKASGEDSKFQPFVAGEFTGTDDNGNAIIITNQASGKKLLLLFMFNKFGKEYLVIEDEFPEEYDGMAYLSKNKKVWIVNGNQSMTLTKKVPRILFGNNNVFSNLRQSVYTYDGFVFRKFKLAQNIQ